MKWINLKNENEVSLKPWFNESLNLQISSLVGCFKNSSKCFPSILCQCFYKTLYNNKWCLIGKNVWHIENDVERGFVTGVNTGYTTFKYLKFFVSNEVRNRMYPTFSTCVIRRFLYLDTDSTLLTSSFASLNVTFFAYFKSVIKTSKGFKK